MFLQHAVAHSLLQRRVDSNQCTHLVAPNVTEHFQRSTHGSLSASAVTRRFASDDNEDEEEDDDDDDDVKPC